MRASEYTDVAIEINECLKKASFEVMKVQEAMNFYKLDYGTMYELASILEALDLCKVSEEESDYEDD